MNKYILILFTIILALTGCKKSSDDINIKTNEKGTDTSVIKEDISKSGGETEKNIINENESGENITQRKTSPEPRKEITTSEVSKYLNQTVTVKGYIAEVIMRPKVNYLNFDKKYPDNTFTAVIFPDDMHKFEDLMKYQNKNVKVTGRISLYKDKPQIIINSTSQIKIIN